MDHFQLRNGELYCEDVRLAEIAATVGTPLYVYSTATMCRHVEALRSALALLDDPLIAYAVKANPNSAVIATLAKPGSAPTSSPAANIGERPARAFPVTRSSFRALARPKLKCASLSRAVSTSST